MRKEKTFHSNKKETARHEKFTKLGKTDLMPYDHSIPGCLLYGTNYQHVYLRLPHTQ